MKIVKLNKELYAFVLGSILGAISFISIYGTKILNITYVDWLMNKGDLTQHYLGWAYFRNDPWSFPLGSIPSFGYPFGVSVVYTDSIPLFALLFKVFSPILPSKFQYFGIWGILCYALQGGIASLIIRKYTDKYLIIGISSLFLIFSPILIQRMFTHTALAGHWILLLAIAVWVYRERVQKNQKIETIVWSIICSLSVLIHPYLAVMVFALLAGYLIHDYLEYHRLKKNILVLATSIISTTLSFWFAGGFIHPSNISEGGLGHFSLNGNALFNPQGWSRFLKDLPLATGGQYEGFMYLGLGTILLIVVNLAMLAFKPFELDRPKVISVGIVCLVLFLLSLSNTVTFNDKVLFTIPLPNFIEKALSVFRATGRLFWPVFYLITLAAIINLIKNKVSNTKLAVLLLCVFILQYSDFFHIYKQKHSDFDREIHYESPLKSPFWTEIADKIENIIRIPATMEEYEQFSWFAVNHGLTYNTGYFARGPYEEISRYATEKSEQVMAGNVDPKDLFVVRNPEEELLEKCGYELACAFVDGYIVAYSSQINLNPNISGAQKITREHISFVDYLTHVSTKYGDKDYLIFASVRDESTTSLNEEIVDKMRQFGMSEDLTGKYRWSYVWAKSTKSGEVLIETLQEAMIEHKLTAGQSIAEQPLRGDIIIKSAGFDKGNLSEIVINGINYSLASRGMNFVVYNIAEDKVVELAAFDLHSKTDGIMLTLSSLEG
jgi:hypothetical protein